MLRFRRHEIHLINSLDSEYFDQMAGKSSGALHDVGASLDSEEIWFNQVAISTHARIQADLVQIDPISDCCFYSNQSYLTWYAWF